MGVIQRLFGSKWEFAVCLGELRPGSGAAPGGGRWEGARETYGGFTLMFGRNQHSTAKQLPFR